MVGDLAEMNFGIAIFPTEYSISMAELAAEVEAGGFESLWVTEHTHIPASRDAALRQLEINTRVMETFQKGEVRA